MTHLRGEADTIQDDAERQRRLREAAQRLADATSRMVEAARSCASSPDDAALQQGLKTAAEELRLAMTSSTREQIRRKALLRLEEAAKRTVAAAGQNISAARASESTNTNMQSVQELNRQCRDVRVDIRKSVRFPSHEFDHLLGGRHLAKNHHIRQT